MALFGSSLTRRDFLRAGAAAGMAASAARATPLEGPAPRSGEGARTVRLGVIGVGGRGTHLLSLALQFDGVEVVALSDIHEGRLKAAGAKVERMRGRAPAGYSGGPTDYRRLLQRDDVDAVIIATPMPLHAPMSIDALRAGKAALSEVAAAMTLDECWGLVRAAEETGRTYMLAENCCYFRSNLVILNMVKEGVFGDLTYAECGYVHDCRRIKFNTDGSLTWRGELGRDHFGNLYPTHSLGPVAQWLGINRGDRMVSLVAMASRQASLARYARKRFGEDHPASRIRFAVGDSTTVLIRTARGAMIDLRYDTCSARPHPSTTYYALQGTTASYESRGERIWIEGKSRTLDWDPLADHAGPYQDPRWVAHGARAAKAGHGGADYFEIHEFIETIRSGRPSPIDGYDAAAWSSIIPLSAESIRRGGDSVEIPDFTGGAWERRKA